MGVVISVEHNYVFIVPLKKSNNENWTFFFKNGRMWFCDYLALIVFSVVVKCCLALLRKLFVVLKLVIQLNQKGQLLIYSPSFYSKPV